MVVTDMDGTLLNSNHEVSPEFYNIFEELKKRDILFIAASGRQYNSIIDKLLPIKDDIIVIAENGGFAMHKEEELFATPLDKASVSKVLKTLEKVDNIHPVLCGKRNSYLRGDSAAFENMLKQYYSAYEIVDDLAMIDAEILKVAVYHFESSEKFIYPEVQHLEDSLKVKVSGPNWVDLSSENANKGYALKKLQKAYNINPSETLVFGDYNNDLEMLACADYSFSMANAHPNVVKAANYQTLSNDENGVEHILKQLLNS